MTVFWLLMRKCIGVVGNVVYGKKYLTVTKKQIKLI